MNPAAPLSNNCVLADGRGPRPASDSLHEKRLLDAYENCVAILGRWLKSEIEAHRMAAVRGTCELLRKGFDFNCRDDLIEMTVSLSRGADGPERQAGCAALVDMFNADKQGEATLVAVKATSSLLKSSSFNVPVEVLQCWLHLSLEVPLPFD